MFWRKFLKLAMISKLLKIIPTCAKARLINLSRFKVMVSKQMFNQNCYLLFQTVY